MAVHESTALEMVPVEERGLRGLEIAGAMYDASQREQIAALLSVPAASPALLPYLALCIAEGFSPWANHVWLIPKKVKVPSADGSGTTEVEKHLPAVGRDGLLHKARQSPIFDDLDFGVVCEHDTFEAWYENREWNVIHRQRSKPTQFDASESPDRYRGRIIGAWAMLFLKGKRPTYYFANLREHGRLRHVWAWNDDAHKRKPLYHSPAGGVTFAEFTKAPQGDGMTQNRPVQEWEGAWDYISTMILKSAQSYVCRIGLGVTGFVPVDELRSVADWQRDDSGPAQAVPSEAVEEFDFESLAVSDDLREALSRAVEAANSQEPFSWGPAKCEMVFSGRSEDELRERLEDIERENDLRERRAEEAAAEPAPIPDAVVVEEKGDASPDAEPSASNEERVAVLMARLAGLRAKAHEATEEQMPMVAEEMDQVIDELKSLGVDPDAPAA